VAEHLSRDLPYELSSDDIFLTAGGTQAIEVIVSVLSQKPGTNILLPKPGYPNYEARAAFSNLEVRRFDLIPEKGWEMDVDSLEAIADENTTAMVLINPNNPCGSVYSYQHLAKVRTLFGWFLSFHCEYILFKYFSSSLFATDDDIIFVP
jgi:nicotianamine aminotransferase